jgi:hypothetical protein
MLKTLLAATTALALMSGAGFAQSSFSSSTTESTQIAPPAHDVDITTSTSRTADRNGVVIEKTEVGSDVTRPGEVTSTRESTSTTVR